MDIHQILLGYPLNIVSRAHLNGSYYLDYKKSILCILGPDALLSNAREVIPGRSVAKAGRDNFYSQQLLLIVQIKSSILF